MELGGAAQRLTGADAATTLFGVMDDEHRNVMPALQLAQVGEQRGDLAAGVLVDAVETYERIEDERSSAWSISLLWPAWSSTATSMSLSRCLISASSSMIPKMSLFVAISFFTAAMSCFVAIVDLMSAMSSATAAKPPSTAFRTVPSVAGLACDFVAAICWAV